MSIERRYPFALAATLVLALLAGCGRSGEDSATPSGRTPGAGGPAADAADAEPLPPPVSDHVVARVNGGEIKNRLLHGAVETNRLRHQAQGMTLDADGEGELRQAVLDAAIADELLYQDALAKGIGATDEEVERDLAQVRSRLGAEEEYKRYLEAAGITEEDVRAHAVRRVIVEKHLRGLAAGAAVTDAEAKAFYDANREMFREPEQARVRIVVVKSTPDDPPPKRQDAKRRIEEARAKVAAGADIAQIAKEYSQIPNAAAGGDLGWFGKGEMFPAIEKAAFELPVGGLSEIFETPTGLNFLKVIERRPSRALPFEEVKARLLVDLGRLKEAQTMERRVAELRKDAKIEVVDEAFLKVEEAPTE